MSASPTTGATPTAAATEPASASPTVTAPQTVTAVSSPLFIQLLAELAAALHRYGAPAHLLEDSISAVAARRGVEAHVLSTPTSITLATGGLQEQEMRLVRIEPGSVDLRRLTEVDLLSQQVAQGDVGATAALEVLTQIHDSPRPLRVPIEILAATGAAATAALFFGGGTLEVLTAGTIGLVVGIAQAATGRSVRSQRIVEPACAVVAAMGSMAVLTYVGPLDGSTTILSGLIPLLPGFTLTVSMTELASRHLVSGTARFASAAMTFLQLGFGAAVGLKLGSVLGWSADWALLPPPSFAALVPALVLGAVAFATIFRVRAQDLGAVIAVAVCGYAGSRLGVSVLGPQLGVFLGALVVGMLGNVWSRWRRLPASVVSVPGILMLVPGSVGFRSIAAFFDADVVQAVGTASSMFVLAASLVAGLLTANVVVAPRGATWGVPRPVPVPRQGLLRRRVLVAPAAAGPTHSAPTR